MFFELLARLQVLFIIPAIRSVFSRQVENNSDH